MVYRMEIFVDGGCRNNGYVGAMGAAAACISSRSAATYETMRRPIPMWEYPPPTNQRAELTGLILGLKLALHKNRELLSQPYLDVTIYADSRYTTDGMNQWIYKWSRNGWLNSKGLPVANLDLFQEAVELHNFLTKLGTVGYVWVPRAQNVDADRECNILLDQMERGEVA